MTTTRPESGDWDAGAFFARLTERNRLARSHGFRYAAVSGLQGFADALTAMSSAPAFLCVSDISDGYTDLLTPVSRRVKTVFLAMRHTADPNRMAEERKQCMAVMREIFRQMMRALHRAQTLLDAGLLASEPRVSFSEMERYFFSGCACAFFQIAVDLRENLCFNPEEWTE